MRLESPILSLAGAVAAALIAAPAAGAPSGLPDWVVLDHFDQVRRINRQLALLKSDEGLRAYYTSAIVPTAYNRSALVFPEDADAARVVLGARRALASRGQILVGECLEPDEHAATARQ